MTPGARVQAAIDILGAIAAAEAPADRVIAGWLRRARYMGGGDRRAVRALIYDVLRHRATLDWWTARAGGVAGAARARVIAWLMLGERQPPEALAGLFDGGRYRPAPLADDERGCAAALAGQPLDHPDQPAPVRGNLPEWLVAELEAAFGDALAEELAALNREAPLDLRVNTLKSDREGARAALAADGLEAVPTPLSPLGLRLSARATLPAIAAFRDGLVEVQDEGSQLAALLVDARPDQAVCDLCAGAGGKTLALAAAMANRGRLLACDVAAARLRPLAPRLRRAGVDIVETLEISAEDDGWPGELAEGFDRVLVDAPCSGSGAWRRNPDARWRLDPETLAGFAPVQDRLLGDAARLVRPGGRLVYVTCSLLPRENADRVAAFLADHGDFRAVPVGEVWSHAVGGAPPADGPYLTLTPARHGTDGFFVAILERTTP